MCPGPDVTSTHFQLQSFIKYGLVKFEIDKSHFFQDPRKIKNYFLKNW